jgi:2-polyprenyl-3-methyl-5-hydroxy-6-metoxy-1,4-benzoquinol methylase
MNPETDLNGPIIQVESAHANRGLYDRYEKWKGWDKPFTYSIEDATYFAGEMRGLGVQSCNLLEIGFGSGSLLAWARDHDAKVAGTEINSELIEAAREAQIELIDSDFERVANCHAGRFDTIVAFDVFEHFSLEEIVVRMRAAETMLKAGGSLILRFPNAQSPFGLAPQNGDPTHKTALSRSSFEQLIQGTSFSVTRYEPSYRIRGGSISKRAARSARAVCRTLVARILNFVYAQKIPWDPVVVLVLRKRAEAHGPDNDGAMAEITRVPQSTLRAK